MRIVPPCALLLPALLLAACQPPAPPLSGTGMDMFAPVTIRLHPLSRIITPVAATVPATAAATASAPATSLATAPSPPPAPVSILEARIELSDQFTDPTKSPGTFTLGLFDQPPLTHKGPLLQAWSLSINTPEENRSAWDRTTRTYLFKLPLAQPLPKRDHLLVTVTLTLPNGANLTDEIELPVK